MWPIFPRGIAPLGAGLVEWYLLLSLSSAGSRRPRAAAAAGRHLPHVSHFRPPSRSPGVPSPVLIKSIQT
uniref:Putative secreted peptide n=1 Tax=Anopheles braziliensis TaxID=58242 RepID=A0A2M3ZXI1_9DIPT